MTLSNYSARHCEERSDEAIPSLQGGDCFASLAMTPVWYHLEDELATLPTYLSSGSSTVNRGHVHH